MDLVDVGQLEMLLAKLDSSESSRRARVEFESNMLSKLEVEGRSESDIVDWEDWLCIGVGSVVIA